LEDALVAAREREEIRREFLFERRFEKRNRGRR